MAIRHLITGSFITLLLLGGCGSVPDTDAGSADAGSAPQQAVIVDPPLDDAAVQDEQAQPLAGVVLCLDPRSRRDGCQRIRARVTAVAGD